MKIPVNDERALLVEINNYIQVNKDKTAIYKITLGEDQKEYDFNYDFEFPLSDAAANALESFKIEGELSEYEFELHGCTFHEDVEVNNHNKNISFYGCSFNEKIVVNSYGAVLTFDNCKFYKEFNAEDSVFYGKVRFRQCTFFENANFRNTTFNELADFWRSTFYNKTIFYKTDFLNTVVLSAAIFKENVLFTYTLINKLLILRGSKAEKGFDLSLAILTGKLSLFEFNLEDYKNVEYIEDEEKYEKAVSELAVIPIKNKRETFRILKDNLESQKNLSESLKYKAIEKEVLRQELNRFINDPNRKQWSNLKHWINNRLERTNLWLNRWSNDHGNSYGRAFIFIIFTAIPLFYLSIMSTDAYSFSLNCNDWEVAEGTKKFFEFLNPIHKSDYLDLPPDTLTTKYYFLDFLGKVIVGYGIYQFIQAFRKYK